jgi:hypothetical protein
MNTEQKPLEFMVGIECTQIVNTRPDLNPQMRQLEQFALLKHYDLWREDFDLIARLRTDGRRVTKVRWCIPGTASSRSRANTTSAGPTRSSTTRFNSASS